MSFHYFNEHRGTSLEHVEPIGVFRCPNCSKVEEENEKLREEIKRLREMLSLEREEDTLD